MDLLLGSFADKHLHAFTPEQLVTYQAILEIGDPDFYDWITGQKEVPPEFQSDVMSLITAHRFKE